MRFKNINIAYKNYSTILIEWEYEPYNLAPIGNFEVEISVSAVKEGPFAQIAVLDASNIYFEHIRPKQKWTELFYKLNIYNKVEKIITYSQIVKVEKKLDVFVKRAREKYSLYLSKLENKAIVFKKKKFGNKCKECWDPLKEKVLKEDCHTCFKTGIGNDSVLGFDKIQIDGWLKMNTDGNLEFFKSDYFFGEYPAMANQGVIPKDDYGVVKGDEFRIETTQGDPIFSFPILEVKPNSLVLSYSGENFYPYLSNCQFSIYRLTEVVRNYEIRNRILKYYDIYHFYNRNIVLSDDISLLHLTDEDKNILSSFDVVKGEDYLELSNGVASYFRDFRGFYLEASDGTLSGFYENDSSFYSNEEEIFLYIPNAEYDTNHRIYIEYYYDGETTFTINSKTEIISNNTNTGIALSLFSIIEANQDLYKLKLETLSNYERSQEEDISSDIYNFCIERFGRQNLNMSVFNTTYASAMQQMTTRITNENTKIQLPHKNIVKTGFSKSGVLMIDIQNGINYHGPEYNAETEEYGDIYDFYVNPDTGEIDTLDLPLGIYEISYIYETKGMKFTSLFAPINPVFKRSRIIDVDGWLLIHPIFKKSILSDNLVLAVKGEGYYTELPINRITESGFVYLDKNNIDHNSFYNSLTEETVLSIDYPKTGGYYNKINTFINVMSSTIKQSYLEEKGKSSPLDLIFLTQFYPTIEPEDIIFEPASQRFFRVISVDPKMFRRQITVQSVNVKELGSNEQINLTELLDR